MRTSTANVPANATDHLALGGTPGHRDCITLRISGRSSRRKGSPPVMLRLVIFTHGFMTDRIRKLAKELKRVAPDLALRISIDGLEATHEKVRGIPGGFQKDMESLQVLKEAGFQDLGIAMTVMEENVSEIRGVYALSQDLDVDFSITVATDSEVYFGADKGSLRPSDGEDLKRGFEYLIRRHFRSFRPRSVARAWFEKSLLDYTRGRGRAIACDAGNGFFYLDSKANVYACHILSSRIGNLREASFEAICPEVSFTPSSTTSTPFPAGTTWNGPFRTFDSREQPRRFLYVTLQVPNVLEDGVRGD